MTYKTPIIIVTALVTVITLNTLKPQPKVISYSIEVPPTEMPTPSPTNTPTPKLTKVPTPTPKPVTKYSSEQIYGFTNEFGGKYGIDPNVIRHIGQCESGFNPKAKNYIYAGLFQFDAPTWKSFRKMMNKDPDPDLRYDAREAVETVAYMLSIHRGALWPNCYPR
jgi:hypothetical protein